jgi:hypothetical protein
MSTRAAKGKAIDAALYQLRHKVSTRIAAIMFGVSIASVPSAARRLGGSLMDVRQNRRIFKNKECYCFRYRTAKVDVYRRLSPDIRKARIMRDKLEQELGLSK